MSGQPSWMPETKEIERAFEAWYALVVESEEDDPQSDELEPIRSLIVAAVKKALAEQWQLYMEDKDAIVQANIRVQNLYSRERNEQEARHKREVIEARIAEIENFDGFVSFERAKEYRAELDALPVEVQP